MWDMIVSVPDHGLSFYFAALKGHRWNCYQKWAISIGDQLEVTTLLLLRQRIYTRQPCKLLYNFLVTYAKGLFTRQPGSIIL